MYIIWFDPGVTVGWASFQKPNDRDGYQSGQFDHETQWSQLDMIHNYRLGLTHTSSGIDLLGYEEFQYRNGLSRADLTPVENIGVIKEWAKQNKVTTYSQVPGQAVGKNAFFNDERLKVLGLHKPGMKHANDAMRHLLYYLSFGPGVRLGEEVIQKLKPTEQVQDV